MGRGYRRSAGSVKYPTIGDPDLAVAKLHNMLPADAGDTGEERAAASNATGRSVFIISLDERVKLMLTYPMTTARDFDEILRVLGPIQLTDQYKVVTPVNRKQREIGYEQRRGRAIVLRLSNPRGGL
ncbi:hypothetical protein [Trinickia mobilis]|uniref:hypothetical protein n=1 Tax=Trinickia mobilis TaxID=2816356 RepID=UPI001A907296|nr:hypothetical protein [Trinickia mobilis]